MTSILDVPGSKPQNSFTAVFDSICASSSSDVLHKTAAHIVTAVTESPDPNTKLYELWDAFFTTVVTHPDSHPALLSFLDVLKTQTPTLPNNVRTGSDAQSYLCSHLQSDGKLHWSLLPGYHNQWRDTHDILEAWRDWDGVRASGAPGLDCPVATYYLRFCEYSAAELKTAKAEQQASLSICVFYACRDVLERESAQPRQLKPHRISLDQLWALDVCVAATWIRDGARALWEMESAVLREHWAAALDEETELWPKKEGLTRERWQLWGDRLSSLAKDRRHFDEATRAIVSEAAVVIKELLQLE